MQVLLHTRHMTADSEDKVVQRCITRGRLCLPASMWLF
jgi:hypothetical protein